MKNYEDHLRRRIKEKELSNSLSLLRIAVEKLWQFQPLVLDFTKHDLKHSVRVINYLGCLLKCNTGKPLTEEEIYILLAAAYLHDIGMQCDVKEVQSACDLDFEKGENGYTRDQQARIREKHTCLMAEWINFAFKENAPDTNLVRAVRSIPRLFVPLIVNVARYHSGPDWMQCPESFRTSQGGEQRLFFLALLLRVADELDIGENRVDIDVVQQFLLQPENALYWWLHYFTTISVDVQSHAIDFQITLHNNDVESYGKLVWENVVEKFRQKNLNLVEELSRRGIHILISNRQLEVNSNPSFPVLPSEIVYVLRPESHPSDKSPTEGIDSSSLAEIQTRGNNRVTEFLKSTGRNSFIGRREIISDFRESVQTLKQTNPPQAFKQIFLLHGIGGIGKTKTIEQFKLILEEVGCIFPLVVDWDEYPDISGSIEMMDILYDKLAAQFPMAFIAFREKREHVIQVRKKIEKLKKEYEKPLRSDTPYYRSESEKTAFRSWLKGQLTEKEIELSDPTGAQKALSKNFVDGLIIAANEIPIVVMMDTFEIVDRIGGIWVQMGLIAHSVPRSPRLIFVISGRRDLLKRSWGISKTLLDEFPEEYIYSRELSNFTKLDIEEFLKNRNLSHNIELINAIHRATFGIPFGVELASNVLRRKKENPKLQLEVEDILAEIPNRDEIVTTLTQRFLKYCLIVNVTDSLETQKEKEQDIDKIFILASLRRYPRKEEMELLFRNIWLKVHKIPLSLGDVGGVIENLQYKYSFVFSENEQMHPDVRKSIRSALLRDRWQFGGQLSEINRAAADYFVSRLQALQGGNEIHPHNYDDPEWQEYKLDLINHLLWFDTSQAMHELAEPMIYADLNIPSFRNKILRFLETSEDLIMKLDEDYAIELKLILKSGDTSSFTGYYADEKLQSAARRIEQGLKDDLRVQRDIALAERYAKEGDLVNALDKIQQVKKTYESDRMVVQKTAAYFSIARQLGEKGNLDNAIEMTNEALELGGQNVHGLAFLADLYLKADQIDNALDCLNKAQSIDPTPSYIQSKLKKVEKLVSVSVNTSQVGKLRLSKLKMIEGNQLSGMGNIVDAIKKYQESVKLFPLNVESYIKLGNALRQLNRSSEALATFEKARESLSKSRPHLPDFYQARVWAGIGAVEYLREENDKAEEAYLIANSLDPMYINSHIGLAKTYLCTNKFNMAQQELNLVIEMQPSVYWAWTYMALTQMFLNQREKSIETFQRSIQVCRQVQQTKNSRLYLVYYTNSINYFGLGHNKEGIFYLKRGLKECSVSGLVRETAKALQLVLNNTKSSEIDSTIRSLNRRIYAGY